MKDKKKLKVTIFGKEYSLLVENEDIAAELVGYVDNLMKETKNDLHDQSNETIAIIAALNIAYEYKLENNKFKEFSVQAIDKIKRIKLLLEESELLSTPS